MKNKKPPAQTEGSSFQIVFFFDELRLIKEDRNCDGLNS